MRNNFRLTVFLPLLLFFYGCNSEKKQVPIKTVRFNNLGELGVHYDVKFLDDSVERDVPKLYRDNVLYRERRKIDSALSLGTLENGFQGQQIRISGNEYGEFKNGWNRYLVFNNIGSWSADVYYMRLAMEDGFTPTIDSLQYQKHSLGEPKIGWNKFIDSLKKLGLFSLPDYALVPGYGQDLHTDEISYEVEIASNLKYRIYSYPGASERVQKFGEAKKFMHIIEFIKNQFIFPEPWTPENETKGRKK